jgi:hypothetical protein
MSASVSSSAAVRKGDEAEHGEEKRLNGPVAKFERTSIPASLDACACTLCSHGSHSGRAADMEAMRRVFGLSKGASESSSGSGPSTSPSQSTVAGTATQQRSGPDALQRLEQARPTCTA